MEQLLERSIAGETLRDLADDYGVSHQTIMRELRELKRKHIESLSGKLLIARREDEPLWLVIPATTGSEIAVALRYVVWVIEELQSLSPTVDVTVQTKPDGVVIGLEEMSPIGGHA